MQASSMRPLLIALMGPAIWAAHFLLMYAAQTVACTVSAASSQGLAVAWMALSAIAAAALVTILGYQGKAALMARPEDASGRFLRHLQIVLAALSLIGVVWLTLAAILLRTQACT